MDRRSGEVGWEVVLNKAINLTALRYASGGKLWRR